MVFIRGHTRGYDHGYSSTYGESSNSYVGYNDGTSTQRRRDYPKIYHQSSSKTVKPSTYKITNVSNRAYRGHFRPSVSANKVVLNELRNR